MGFLKDLIRNAIGDGIRRGVSDAVSREVEKAVAPKAEEYAEKVAESLDEAGKNAEKYAETLEKAANAQEDLIKLWNEKVPGFPVWCFGGTDFRFDETGTAPDGAVYYVFCAENTTQEGLDMYVALLKQNGFVRKYPSGDEVLYKDLGGEYLVFGKTDAFGTAPVMTLSMVRTKDRSEIEC